MGIDLKADYRLDRALLSAQLAQHTQVVGMRLQAVALPLA